MDFKITNFLTLLINLLSKNVTKLSSNFSLPMNNSSSKQLYTFSRAQRFQPSRRSECKRAFYQTTRGAIQKRATTFGYGNKATFASTQNVPSSGAYNKTSEFVDNKLKKRGYSFGNNQNRSLIDNPQQIRRFPGPGSYISINQKHKTGYGSTFEQISYSMRGKYQNPLEKHGNQLGPGHYPVHEPFSDRGHYFTTKYPSSKCQIIGRQGRFELQKIQSPGPGHYYGEKKVDLNGTGTYFNSKYATTKANAFGLSERPSPAKRNQAPDPGHYHIFTQFALRNKQASSFIK